MNTEIIVRSGTTFDPLNPKAELIQLTDIAHGLSNVCRFSGHPVRFYSVAQHSLLVCAMLKYIAPETFHTQAGQLLGLFHDASEAYLGDVATPLKQHPGWAAYRQYEEQLQGVIERKYVFPGHDGIAWEDLRCDIKNADTLAFVFEARHLLGADWSHVLPPNVELPPRENFKPWNPPEAKRRWLEHHAMVMLAEAPK